MRDIILLMTTTFLVTKVSYYIPKYEYCRYFVWGEYVRDFVYHYTKKNLNF